MGDSHNVSSGPDDGLSLEDLLRQSGGLTMAQGLEYLRQAARALQAVHEEGHVHGDVRPGNLKVSLDGSLKLVGHGAARPTFDASENAELRFASAPYYVSPEVGKGSPGDARSDIYSLGATFYHLLSGNPPFMGPHPMAILVKHAGEDATPLCDLDPSIPRSVSDVIDRMMAKAPADRYRAPGDAVADLDGRAAPAKRAAKKAPKAKGRAVSRRRTTGSQAPVKRAAPGAPSKRPLVMVLAGGAGMMMLIAAIIFLGGEDPAIGPALRDIATARQLLSDGDVEQIDEASALCRGAIAALPGSPRGLEVATQAERVRDAAEAKYADFAEKELRRLVVAQHKGQVGADSVYAYMGRLRARYAQPGIPERFVRKSEEWLSWADKVMTQREAEAPASPPSESPPIERRATRTVSAGGEQSLSAVVAIMPEVDAQIAAGEYDAALAMLDAALEVAQSDGERRLAEAKKRQIRALAASASAPRREPSTTTASFQPLARAATGAVAGGGKILLERWNDAVVPGLPNPSDPGACYHRAPDVTGYCDSFCAPQNVADQFVSRMSGYVHPPVTGEYVFWIVSDDTGQLWLSGDESPANIRRIASVGGYTRIDEWDKEYGQKSQPVRLEAGRRYYVEAVHREGSKEDLLAVGWMLPDGRLERPIPGARLSAAKQVARPTVSWQKLPGHGLAATYYGDVTLTSVVVQRLEPEVNFNWVEASPAPGQVSPDEWSLRMEATVTPPASGEYVFVVTVDDGARLFVDGRLVIDAWQDGAERRIRGEPVRLEKGRATPLRLEYFENAGKAVVRLAWIVPGDVRPTPIPNACLMPPASWKE